MKYHPQPSNIQEPLEPLAQLAFAAAQQGARALLCAARNGLSGHQLPAGKDGRGFFSEFHGG